MEFRGEGQSRARVTDAVDAARESGFDAVSANDHLVFSTPWLDGLTALASVIERSGEMTLATTISLAAVRGPVSLAKALAALDLLSEGRVIAGVGPGSSKGDYDAMGIRFEERWKRFEESVVTMRHSFAESFRGRRRTSHCLGSTWRPVLTSRTGYRSGLAVGALMRD
jgi:alkanesulfonate monooxygenase SsuD/methylene tetrahydromethanopterin reductase-like flavin-dependent oxidoreductase (luciferase family)